MRVLLPGSYDPVTNGHLDIISRLVSLADAIIVGVASNSERDPIVSVEERVLMLQEVCRPWPVVEITIVRGLVAQAARQVGAEMIVRERATAANTRMNCRWRKLTAR